MSPLGDVRTGCHVQAHRSISPGYAWIANYPDPAGYAPVSLLDDNAFYPTFNDPTYQRRLTHTGQLTGPNRYTAYGKLDLDLARNAAPLIAYGTNLAADFFSTRVGCQTYTGVYVGMDIAALCIKPSFR